ncbi:MAG: translation initiation factor IF-3 [Candidatus Glassbacteria bacterium]|nr:translation initiation factor IF-3 [Candidatus Glassbacteria bacterium]
MSTKNVRVNSQIRISPIRLIDDEGNQVGVVELEEARAMARERELDLVEVAPNARPPVVRIMDYGKYKYQENKKAKEAKKKQHVVQLKEIKLRSKIDDHDLDFKMRHARKFLEKQNKVKVTMVFRGREVVHKELGEDVLHRFFNEVGDLAVKESEIKMEGRNMILVLIPKSTDKGDKSKV